ncbi:MAG: elongation factor 4 [Candidatus Moranbacteria bacterium CG23_combo_of_CG06-09_8_20_14_all_35_22]|nr:MAG: elongation factor 4 [Candidatus Moranbacteria bacterium CG23_combo_of_CG06-09_8_20_14_all_35_22]
MLEKNSIRNFCIIAHIDHGKSTLADRMLEMTGTIEKRKMKEQLLDQMDLERERGITIKMTPVRMLYRATQINADCDADKCRLLYEELTYKIRGAIFNVYNTLGPGHKESVYGNALAKELSDIGIFFVREKSVNVIYKNKKVGTYKPDFIVDEKIILELKALPFVGKIEKKQTWYYLKGTDYRLALLVNFGNKNLQIERIVCDIIRDNPHISENQRENPQSSALILNLIDTPGHVDFGYEVSRSLAAVEGAVLLVDATKGVQAQTLANLYQAIEHNLEIIPVVNKIDLPNANIEKSKREIMQVLGCKEEEILEVSGKTGQNVEKLLEKIVEKIPSPKGDLNKPLRALIFDSKYDTYKGVLAHVRVFDGEIRAEEEIVMMINDKKSDVIEVGYFKPNLVKAEKLSAGEIGYIATGLKSVSECKVGDTITSRTYADGTRTNAEKIQRGSASSLRESATQVVPLPGYKEVVPMVYASFYPVEGDDYNLMRDSLDKLKLNDAAFVFEPESNLALGRGFRCGFLGLLHLEIIQSRLEREFQINPTITTPSVVYEVKLRNKDGRVKIFSPSEFPDPSEIEEIFEPYVSLEIVSPSSYLGPIMEVMKNTRSEYLDTQYLDAERMIIKFNCPLTDVVTNLHDDLKSASSGYASMNYEVKDYRPYDLVKLDILVAEEKVDAFSRIVPRENAHSEGKRIVEKLKEVIPTQNFQIALQAVLGAKIIARETIKAFRKDVIAKLYGGDVTRKKKLLEKQKKGKKKMKNIGRVSIPPEAFLSVLKK